MGEKLTGRQLEALVIQARRELHRRDPELYPENPDLRDQILSVLRPRSEKVMALEYFLLGLQVANGDKPANVPLPPFFALTKPIEVIKFEIESEDTV